MKGKVIINTRPAASGDQIGEALQALGAEVLSMPMIEVHPGKLTAQSLHLLANAKPTDWLVFTSRNGVDSLFDQIETTRVQPVAGAVKIAVFGKRTANALTRRGMQADLVNLGNSSKDLLIELKPLLRQTDTVFLILGNLASGLLEDGLKTVAKVERINIYTTSQVASADPGIMNRIRTENYDLILFTSPSGFHSFVHHASNLTDLHRLKIACLGTTTEKAILQDGLTPLVVARPSGKIGLIQGIRNYFAGQNTPLALKINP
ncbi:MAG: uroporphyrinogen-III synthase [Bacteroidales bacterium]|nr:uroporphyrinogen-III synthase [Bacteroidales bacterium]